MNDEDVNEMFHIILDDVENHDNLMELLENFVRLLMVFEIDYLLELVLYSKEKGKFCIYNFLVVPAQALEGVNERSR